MVQPIFKISRGQKNYLILRIVKMGGNFMVEKYL
jgi:hypothetical protein